MGGDERMGDMMVVVSEARAEGWMRFVSVCVRAGRAREVGMYM